MAEDQHQYKLLYFDIPGRAEHIRYIFAYAGVEYEDFRFQKDQWPEIKKCRCCHMYPSPACNNFFL